MIASSPMVKGAALLTALALHAALLWDYGPNPIEAQTEGASGALQTRLGDSFEDMTKGALAPMPAHRSEAQPAAPLPARPVTAATAQNAAKVAALPAQTTADRPEARDAQPTTAQPTTANTAAQAGAPPLTSPRPLQRPKALEPKPAAVPKQKPKTPPQKGARQDSRKGAQTGTAKATEAPKSTGTAKTKAAGNAAARTYAGQVMRKISRVPKPRVSSTGSATVRFTIAAGGGLASASIVQSSGSAALDRAALKVIARAAPFPKPPAGAQRSFTLTIRGK